MDQEKQIRDAVAQVGAAALQMAGQTEIDFEIEVDIGTIHASFCLVPTPLPENVIPFKNEN